MAVCVSHVISRDAVLSKPNVFKDMMQETGSLVDVSCRYVLSQHPEAERNVLQELDNLQLLATPERPCPRSLTSADLNRLQYLSCVVKVSGPFLSQAAMEVA